MVEYYIYHIKGIKIGCTDNIERRLEQQGYKEFEILETHTDIFKASNRELALQKKYGYQIDRIPYFKSVERWGSKAGKIGGRNAVTTQKQNKLGLHTNDKTKRSEWSSIGGKALREKYDDKWFSERGRKGGGNIQSKLVCSKPVLQYDKLNNFLLKHNSINEAHRNTGILAKSISNCLRGKSKTSGGFIWRYQI